MDPMGFRDLVGAKAPSQKALVTIRGIPRVQTPSFQPLICSLGTGCSDIPPKKRTKKILNRKDEINLRDRDLPYLPQIHRWSPEKIWI